MLSSSSSAIALQAATKINVVARKEASSNKNLEEETSKEKEKKTKEKEVEEKRNQDSVDGERE